MKENTNKHCSKLTSVGRGVAKDSRLDAHNVPHGRDACVSLVGEQIDIVVLVAHDNVVLERSVLHRDLDDVASNCGNGNRAGSKTRLDMTIPCTSIVSNFYLVLTETPSTVLCVFLRKFEVKMMMEIRTYSCRPSH